MYNIKSNININNNLKYNITNPNITDLAFCAIKKDENHPRILKIKEIMGKKAYHFLSSLLRKRKYLLRKQSTG